jgi:Fe-S cluster biogenesis protein NfuA
VAQPVAPSATPPTALHARVEKIVNLIRPAVQADGGDIEFVGITSENIVQIRMHGACVGCPSSAVTLQTGIERNLREHAPEVRGVVSVD